MDLKAIRFLVGFSLLLVTASCGDKEKTHAYTLIDAAEIFNSRGGALSSIRAFYPGPYEGFTRIPARDPAEASRLDTDFINLLREDIPVEFVDFFPIGNTGKDEVNVILWRYQTGDTWNTVSLVWFGMPMTLADDQENIQSFESCDQKAVDWLESRRKEGRASVFCRLDDNWHAYQKME